MTLGKVAERAGVAVDTARKVLRKDPSVRPYIRERVLKAVKELDYQPNLVARALRGDGLKIVPIAVRTLGEFYFGALASQISHHLVDIGMEPALCFNAEHLMKMCRSFSTNGSILVLREDYETVHELSRRQKVVTIDSLLPAIPSVGNVSIDFDAIYRHLAETLLKRGRRRIAVDSGHYQRCLEKGWPIQKVPAVFDVLAEAGLDTVGPASRHVFGSSQELVAWIDAHPKSIDAIICENDLEAARVIGELAARGLKTPDDVLVVGCDANCKLAGMWSVKLDTHQIAGHAVSILKRLLDGERVRENPEYMPELLDEFDQPIPLPGIAPTPATKRKKQNSGAKP
ncbi:MAG: LacI family DNA-binding transcriptional regulator [Kiritimatiellia bacterium]